jgi:hypothetical protein
VIGRGSIAGPAPSGARVAFGFADTGVGGALAVASGLLVAVSSSAGTVVFAGTGVGEGLAVASGFLAVVTAGEAVGSAAAVAP